MCDPGKVIVESGGDGGTDLQGGNGERNKGKEKKAKPMSERTLWQGRDGVPFLLACELVAVPWNDEEVLNIFTDDFAIISPERCHGI